MKRTVYTKGMVALFTSIVISTVLLFSCISISTLVYYLNESSLNRENKRQSKFIALACVDRAVVRIIQDESYTPQTGYEEDVPYENSLCEVVSVEGSKNKLIRVIGKHGNSHTNLEAVLDRSRGDIQIHSYREYDHF